MKRILIGLLSVAIATLLWLLVWEEFEGSSQPVEEVINPKTPEFVINNFESRHFNEAGELESLIRANELIKFAMSGNSKLAEPGLEYFEVTDSGIWKWIISAQRGTLNEKEKTISFAENVKIQRVSTDDPDSDKFTMRTSVLYLDLARKTFSSNKKVTIYTSIGNTHSTGITGSLNSGKLHLPAKVKGVYRAAGFKL